MQGICDPLTLMHIRGNSVAHTFGMVRRYANGRPKPHQGWDLAATPGTPIFAVADGTIEFVDDHGDYGKQLCLRFTHHGVAKYAFYAHLSSTLVQGKHLVKAGQHIGATGTTGNARTLPAKDAHLHFEIRLTPRPGLGLGGRETPAVVLGIAAVQGLR